MGYSAKQRKVKTTVEGADALVKDLKAMEEAAADALMAAAKAGDKIALEDAKRNCPVDTGALKQSLHLTDGKATAVKATVQVDYDKSLKYGTHVELGSRNRPANPFMRNAVDDNQNKINDAITAELSRAVGRKI